jgi:DNA-binding CsgD family transcriptional regulator/PAS domain-containing protein
MSDLIGMIYDCAIEPGRWPQTLAEICRTLNCVSGGILLLDLDQSRHRFAYTWGLSSDWANRPFDFSDTLTGFYRRAFSREICADGEPLLLSRLMERVGQPGRKIYDDWTQPQGLSEVMQTVVLRQSHRLAVFNANRHESVAELTDAELTITRLLVPHIRRAVTIIDILDVRQLEIQTLAATLDSISAGIVVVADQGRILHANRAAREMLSKHQPISSVNGMLSIRDAKARQELIHAIELARVDEAAIGANGIGVPLRDPGSAVAHVLPLARGELRTRFAAQAAAAVFITQPAQSPPRDVGAIAANFGLTPAETRMLEQLAGGASLGEVARALNISANTAKTHLSRIFSKTGVSRQADLLSLINTMVPPVQRSKGH